MGITLVLFFLLLAAPGLGLFAFLTIRKGAMGAAEGLPGLLGSVLSYGLVSAWIGYLEHVWSWQSTGFWIAIALGTAGVCGVAFSALRAWSM